MDAQKIAAAINIAMNLVKAGWDIYATLKGKDNLTDEEIQAIIDRENTEQEKARAELKALLAKSA